MYNTQDLNIYSTQETCVNCNSICNTCQNGLVCSSCKPKFYLDKTYNCSLCDLNCLTCYGGLYTNCLSCKQNLTLINNVCFNNQSANNLTQTTSQTITNNLVISYSFITQIINSVALPFLSMNVSAQLSLIQQSTKSLSNSNTNIIPNGNASNMSLNNTKSNNQSTNMTNQTNSTTQQSVKGSFFWLSFAFNNNPHNSDLLVIKSDGISINAFDGQIYSNSWEIQKDDQLVCNQCQNQGYHNDVYVLNTYNDSQQISIQFIRPLNTSETQDAILTQTQKMIWAYGLGYEGTLMNNQVPTDLQFYHGNNRGYTQLGVVNASLILQCDQNCAKNSCSHGICNQCINGYYLISSACQQCDPSCLTCQGQDQTSCLSCESHKNSMNIYLIEGQCLNEQTLDDLINHDNDVVNGLSLQGFQDYVIQFGIIYGISSSPFDDCSTKQCVYGYCLNGVCQCNSQSLGYLCEISNKMALSTIPKFQKILNRMNKSSSLINPKLLSELDRDLTNVSYALNSSTVEQNLQLIQKLISQISGMSVGIQAETYSFLVQSLLNMLEYQSLYPNSTETSIKDLLLLVMETSMKYVMNNGLQLYVKTNYGFVYQAALNLTQQDLENNLQVLRKFYSQDYVSYLQLYNDSTVVMSAQKILNVSSVQLDMKIYNKLFQVQPFPQDIMISLRKIQTPYLNQSNLICVSYIGINKSQSLSQPSLNGSYYTCSISSGRVMVAQKNKELSAQLVSQGVWSQNNIGFFSCLVIECITIFLFVALYGYDKYNEKLVKTFLEVEEDKNKQDNILNEDNKFYLVKDGLIISPIVSPQQSGHHTKQASRIPLFQQEKEEEFNNIALSNELSKIDAREDNGTLDSFNDMEADQFEEQQLNSKRLKFQAVANSVGRGDGDPHNHQNIIVDSLNLDPPQNEQIKGSDVLDEYQLKSTAAQMSQTQTLHKDLQVSAFSMKQSQGSNAPIIKVNSVDENGNPVQKRGNQNNPTKKHNSYIKEEVPSTVRLKLVAQSMDQPQPLNMIHTAPNALSQMKSPSQSQLLSPDSPSEHQKDKDSLSGSEATHQDQLGSYDLWNSHPIISLIRSVQHHRKLIWQLHFLSLFTYTIHVYLLILIFCFDIYVAINGSTIDVPEFIVFTIVAVVVSWPFNYSFGFLACALRKEDDNSTDHHETKQTLSLLYWPIWMLIIFCMDFFISWRAYFYGSGVPDYYLAAAIFCPLFEFVAIDSIFILILNSKLQNNQEKEYKILNLLKLRGFLQMDLYQRSKDERH